MTVEPAAPTEAFVVMAYPSPTDEPVCLAVSLPEPGAVTVSAFDLLGRLIYTRTEELVAGAGYVELDATRWSPGVYIVRLAPALRVAAARVVVQ